jgi:hypothetical protein
MLTRAIRIPYSRYAAQCAKKKKLKKVRDKL